MIQWFRDWKQARREAKIFDALFLLAMMDSEEQPCAICEDNPEKCICEDGPDCD